MSRTVVRLEFENMLNQVMGNFISFVVSEKSYDAHE